MKTEPSLAEEYRRQGWWTRESVGQMLRHRAITQSDSPAYLESDSVWTWAQYDAEADAIAGRLSAIGVAPGDRVALHLPDGALQHASLVATERVGAIAVGIPGRADEHEVTQLVMRSGANVLVVSGERSQAEGEVAFLRLRDLGASVTHYVMVRAGGDHTVRAWTPDGVVAVLPDTAPVGETALAPDDVWMLNFTSGTTGLPKAVKQTQNRWYYLAGHAAQAAGIDERDRVLCAVPGPYGFGVWTGHLLPVMAGIPCTLVQRFSPDDTLRMIERDRISVLACVTTQLVMMMSSPLFAKLDLSSLRVVFTGGERVPTRHATRWEEVTGSRVLQFYGSNEAGPFSCTSLADDDHTRLTTAGRIVPGVTCRLLEPRREEDDRGPVLVGQATLKSPGAHAGYWNDDDGDAQLWTEDGFLILPDVVAIDAAETVRVVGRKSDIIIRGGKNISAAVIEEGVEQHPGVFAAAAVPVPDETFGERIGVAVVLTDPDSAITLDRLATELVALGVPKEHLPEHLRVVPEIPTSLGAKADKQRIRALFVQ